MRDLRNMINNEVIIQSEKTLDVSDQWPSYLLVLLCINE